MASDIESPDQEPGEEQQRRANIKSEIAFPYANLEEVSAVAKAMFDAGSVPMTRDQIAGRMAIDPKTSTLGVKLGSAKTFGIITATEGKYSLTPLGIRLVSTDEAEARAARAEAFSEVELYQKLIAHFRNMTLPGRDAVEAAIEHYGVSERQKDKARQAFERSAIFAGYMTASKERLVAPILAARNGEGTNHLGTQIASPPRVDVIEPPKPPRPADHSLVRGMLDLMPPIDSDWPMAARTKWVRALVSNLAMIYKASDEADLEITPKKLPPAPLTVAQKPSASKPSPSSGSGPSWEPASGDLDDEIPF